jgi:hypothetical protein
LSRRNVLLLWADPKERQALYKILCATGAHVQFVDPGEALSPAGLAIDCKLAIIDYDSIRAGAKDVLEGLGKRKRPPAVLVLTATRDKNELIELFSHEVLTNLIAKNTDIKASELIVTVQKILHNDLFGFEKYLTWGISPIEEVVTSSSQKDEILENVDRYLTNIGCNKRLIALAKTVGDEFLMNAVYNAPVDGKGKAKYASRSRAERVDLVDGEAVRFRYVCDGRLLAMSVSDNFGRLERSTVLSYLRKCFMRGSQQIDQKDGGAGLGLYYIFESLNQFVINLAPMRRTEMIGMMDISGTYKDFVDRPKSLNIFIEEAES